MKSKTPLLKYLNHLKKQMRKMLGMVKYRMFPFSLKTRELGEINSLFIQTSSKNYNPLARTILNTKEQLQLKTTMRTQQITITFPKRNLFKRTIEQ